MSFTLLIAAIFLLGCTLGSIILYGYTSGAEWFLFYTALAAGGSYFSDKPPSKEIRGTMVNGTPVLSSDSQETLDEISKWTPEQWAEYSIERFGHETEIVEGKVHRVMYAWNTYTKTEERLVCPLPYSSLHRGKEPPIRLAPGVHKQVHWVVHKTMSSGGYQQECYIKIIKTFPWENC